MRFILSFLSWLLLASTLCYAQNKPDWLTERPNGTFFYIGIGSASKSSTDYQQKAKQNAIAELVSEIEIKVSANSLMTTMEQDNEQTSSFFSEVIQTSVSQHIKNFEQVDNWQDDQTYWVYYRLDKESYAEQVQLRREQAIRSGFDFWCKGESALQQGDLLMATDLFIQGLNAIEPCANEDLSCLYEGQTILVGNVLYASLESVFNGIRIIPSHSEIEAKAFQASHIPVELSVNKDGTPLRNISIKGEFVSGSGTLSDIPPTDNQGKTTGYIQNITSKNTIQEIRYSLDMQPFAEIKSPLFENLKKQLIANTPRCLVSINDKSSKSILACLQSRQQGNEGIIRGIRSLLTNNYFNITDSPNNADILLLITSEFTQGNTVEGDIYNMKEYFTTVNIEIKNNRNGAVLTSYQLEKKRTLSPANTSLANARNTAIREVMKIINREFGKQLKDLKIDTDGDIPQQTYKPVLPKYPNKHKTPAPQPVIIEKPAPSIVPADPKDKRMELEPGIFICYTGKKDLSDRTFLKFNIENKNQEDYIFSLYASKVLIVNGKGEEVKCGNIKIGSKQNTYQTEGTIVPDTPTLLEIEIKKTDKVSLFQLTNTNRRTIKLRNLE